MDRDKPTVNMHCVASNFQAPNQRIIEFGNREGGGLISFRTLSGGVLEVEIYRCDPNVRVVGANHGVGLQRAPENGRALSLGAPRQEGGDGPGTNEQ